MHTIEEMIAVMNYCDGTLGGERCEGCPAEIGGNCKRGEFDKDIKQTLMELKATSDGFSDGVKLREMINDYNKTCKAIYACPTKRKHRGFNVLAVNENGGFWLDDTLLEFVDKFELKDDGCKNGDFMLDISICVRLGTTYKDSFAQPVCLKSIPTYKLVEELEHREGVKKTYVAPYTEKNISGPARVLVITD